MKPWYFTLCITICGLSLPGTALSAGGSDNTLNDEPTEYLADGQLPPRTGPLLELGPKFLSTGNITPGFETPTGAVWTPSLWVFGTLRSAVQYYEDDNGDDVGEWANRLDLFANLQLSGTERILLGVTPLHNRKTGAFSGRVFSPDGQRRTIDELNLRVDTLFFEGDISELFPNWDAFDSLKNDVGFSIGRQNVFFGGGFIVNDTMDGFGISKNNIRFTGNPNIINWRSTFFFGFSGVTRDDNEAGKGSKFYGWFNQIDTIKTTYNIDFAYVDSDTGDDLLNIGIDATRRFGKTNATFRVVYSNALGDVTSQADTGVLLFTELSWVPRHTHNNLYFNGFAGFGQFTSAARGPLTGGPLGRTGLLFAAQGIGSFPAPLSNRAGDAAGVAFGYQMFSKDRRTQLTLEAGARFEYEGGTQSRENEFGFGARVQQAIGNRTFIQLDAFVTKQQGQDVATGIRCEFQVKI